MGSSREYKEKREQEDRVAAGNIKRRGQQEDRVAAGNTKRRGVPHDCYR